MGLNTPHNISKQLNHYRFLHIQSHSFTHYQFTFIILHTHTFFTFLIKMPHIYTHPILTMVFKCPQKSSSGSCSKQKKNAPSSSSAYRYIDSLPDQERYIGLFRCCIEPIRADNCFASLFFFFVSTLMPPCVRMICDNFGSF